MKSYKTHSFVNGLKFTCLNAIKEKRWKIVLTFVFIIIAIFTGVFIAIKTNKNCDLGRLQEISLTNFYAGIAGSASAFLSKSLSLIVNVALLTLLALSPALFPLAQILFIYRGYLFGLNFALIFIFYGIGSIITAVVVILPCQLAIMVAFVLYVVLLSKMNKNCKKFGRQECNRFLFILIGFLFVLLINLVETLLLVLLNGKVILVI